MVNLPHTETTRTQRWACGSGERPPEDTCFRDGDDTDVCWCVSSECNDDLFAMCVCDKRDASTGVSSSLEASSVTTAVILVVVTIWRLKREKVPP